MELGALQQSALAAEVLAALPLAALPAGQGLERQSQSPEVAEAELPEEPEEPEEHCWLEAAAEQPGQPAEAAAEVVLRGWLLVVEERDLP